MNFGAALAHAGNMVVAVDADLANRALSRVTGLRTEAGLADVLSGRANLDSVLMPTKSDNLAVVGAGTASTHSSTDLLASKEFGRLLAELGNRFDFVIIDSAAVLGSADALASVASADGLIVVARRKTRLSDLRRVRDRLADLRADVIGMVYCDFAKATTQDAVAPPATESKVVDDETRRARSAHRI
jgi:Mrp family chromosome partitioning ATPase